MSWTVVPRRQSAAAKPSQIPTARDDYPSIIIKMGSRAVRPMGDDRRPRCGFIRLCERLERPSCNFGNTVGNVVKAATVRVFVDRPAWAGSRNFTRVMNAASYRLGAQLPREPLSDEQVREELNKYPPGKRAVYASCGEKRRPATLLEWTKIGFVKVFVKSENVPAEKDKPRLIQFRMPDFLYWLLWVLKPIEHCFYNGRYLWNTYQKVTCAKGLNNLRRMSTLLWMKRSLRRPCVVGLDGSAFDAHVPVEALKAEWRFYGKAAKAAGWGSEALKALRLAGEVQVKNRCRAVCDDGEVSYKVKGNRMSGDLNTGLGNSVLQSAFIAAAMADLRIPDRDWRMLVDGDDAVLMVEHEHKEKCHRLPEVFEGFSQELKVTEVTELTDDNLECIEFCQSRPVRVGPGPDDWRLVRDPRKVYNGYNMVGRGWYLERDLLRRFFSSVAPAELIFATGLPVHEAMFRCFHRLSGSMKPLTSVASRFWIRNIGEMAPNIRPLSDISLDVRESYHRAFGISPLEQLSIEAEFDSWQIEHLPESPTDLWPNAAEGGVTVLV